MNNPKTNGALPQEQRNNYNNGNKNNFELLSKLALDYRRVMETRQLELMATYMSTKQTAWAAIANFGILFIAGTAIVKVKTGAPMAQAVLFSVYTFTSAGFGNVDIPDNTAFLIFVTLYVYLAISSLAILVAQTFQYAEVKASRWKHAHDKGIFAAQGERALGAVVAEAAATQNTTPTANATANANAETETDQKLRYGILQSLKLVPRKHVQVLYNDADNTDLQVDTPCSTNVTRIFWSILDICKVPLFLVATLLVGTFTMMGLEGWTFVEALYFSTFAMTTVGYGDLAPTNTASTWFVNFWLPMNVAFMAVYLGGVAHWYVRFNQWNTNRMERHIKRIKQHEREQENDRKKQKQLQQQQQRRHNTNSVRFSQNKDDTVPQPQAQVVAFLDDHSQQNNNTANGDGEVDIESNVGTSGKQQDERSDAASDAPLPDTEGGSLEDRPAAGEPDTNCISGATTPMMNHQSGVATNGAPEEMSQVLTALLVNPAEREVGLNRRDRIRQFSNWSAGDRTGFFSYPSQQESLEESLIIDGDAKIETTHDLIVQLGLTKTTGQDLLASERNASGSAPLKDPGLLKLRIHVKVLERLARIIVAEAKDVHSEVEVNGSALSVSMEYLKDIAERWSIPTRARESFRSVTFASLIFVGEREIYLRGVDAFFSLNPSQFYSVFGPFVVALEDTDTMTEWLVRTQSLRDQLVGHEEHNNGDNSKAAARRKRRAPKNKIEAYFPPNPGNVVRINMPV